MKLVLGYFALITLLPLALARSYQFIKEETFVIALLWALIIALPVFYTNFKKACLWILGTLATLLSLIELGHILLFQGRMTENSLYIIFDTNLAETNEFLRDQLGLLTIAVVIGFLALSFSLMYLLSKRVNQIQVIPFKKYLTLFILLPFLVILGSKKFDFRDTLKAYAESNTLPKSIVSMKRYEKEIAQVAELQELFKQHGGATKKTTFSNSPSTHILIIGESTTKNKMGLFGYKRPTTPELDKLSPELTLFKNTYASYPPGTLENLKKLLTFWNSENEKTHKLDTHIINIMKEVGFKTFWVSNQLMTGRHNNMTTAIARSADKTYFTNTTDAKTFDEKLLPIVSKVLKDPAPHKFIIIHLLGTHLKYRERFPSEFEVFKTTEDIPRKPFMNDKKRQYYNDYDNAVLYNDFVVSELIKISKNLPSTSTITYLSDHGEEVYDQEDFHGHPGVKTTPNMLQIPLIMWLAPKFQNQKSALGPHQNTPIVSDDLIHTFLDLYEIQHKHYDGQKSLLSGQFVPKKTP